MKEKIFQFKIELVEISPPIWRQIQVPASYTFWDLHIAIQDVMGWLDYHLHEFIIKNPKDKTIKNIAIPDEEFPEYYDERKERIADYFNLKNREALYIYDFGDEWVHKLTLEKIIEANPKTQYPICIAGERATPPEDCGGIPGYIELCDAMKDPFHPRRKELLEWLGEEFDPEYFNPKEVLFRNTKKIKNL